MADQVVALDQGSFKEFISGETPVLVDFWAAWCGPCKMMAPIIDDVAAHFGDRLQVAKLNVDENSELATKCGILNIPTLVFYRNGVEEDRFIGYHTKEDLALEIEQKL